MNPSIGRLALNLGMIMVVLSLLSLPVVDRSSPEFVLAIMGLLISTAFVATVILLIRREVKSRTREDPAGSKNAAGAHTDRNVLLACSERCVGTPIDRSIKGADNIVVQVDFGLRPSGSLEIGGRRYDLRNVRRQIYFDSEEAIIENGSDRMVIQGGGIEHRVSDGWRGFDPWERYGKRTVSLLSTPVAPLEKEIAFRFS